MKHVYGVWEKARMPGENLQMQRENVKNPYIKKDPAEIQTSANHHTSMHPYLKNMDLKITKNY